MMVYLRAYLIQLMIAVLVLTGLSMAVARGTPATAGQIEICTGSGPIMVVLDEDGNPTGQVHYCPESAMTLMNALADVPVLPVPISVRSERVMPERASAQVMIRPLRAVARAPPVAA